jgi:transposase
MMERYSKVGMQELDQRLSKIVEAARKRPVSVYRYGAPWVWIVSQEDWQGALREVSSCIPPGHSLALLRPQIEHLLDAEQETLDQVARRCNLRVDPSVLVKALLLRLLYSVPSEQHLHEQLSYNLLYRWFVGLEMGQRVWDFSTFVGDSQRFVEDIAAVHVLGRIVGEVILAELLQMPEFSMNFAQLHAWQARHELPLNK